MFVPASWKYCQLASWVVETWRRSPFLLFEAKSFAGAQPLLSIIPSNHIDFSVQHNRSVWTAGRAHLWQFSCLKCKLPFVLGDSKEPNIWCGSDWILGFCNDPSSKYVFFRLKPYNTSEGRVFFCFYLVSWCRADTSWRHLSLVELLGHCDILDNHHRQDVIVDVLLVR